MYQRGLYLWAGLSRDACQRAPHMGHVLAPALVQNIVNMILDALLAHTETLGHLAAHATAHHVQKHLALARREAKPLGERIDGARVVPEPMRHSDPGAAVHGARQALVMSVDVVP